MKRNFLASLLALCAIAGQAQGTQNSNSAPLDSIIIEGVVTNIADGTHFPLIQDGTNSMQETIVKDGKFRIAVLPHQEEETYLLLHGHCLLYLYAKPGMKIKVKGDSATSVYYWGVESDHFDQKENNAYNQFLKEKLSDYYELYNRWSLGYGRSFDESLTQEERDKVAQEERELYQQLEALRKEKYNAAILDFMKDRPFSKRMIEDLHYIVLSDHTPAIVEKAREIFKKTPQEVMDVPLVAETKARLYAERVKIGEQMKDFTLFDRELKTHQLSEFKGKYTILEFTFRGCSGCIFVKPFLEEFYKRNNDKAEIIAIYHDTKENWMKEGQEHKVSYHEWSDPAQASEPVAAYDVNAYPTFVIIDPNGKILDIKEGASGFYEIIKKYIPDAEFEKKLEKAIKS
ncbi:MAG: TlpA family protein disulfide reductase [Prevotella sp.]|nr:TlpA family protein disulfide reductase [Prevotella sp.]